MFGAKPDRQRTLQTSLGARCGGIVLASLMLGMSARAASSEAPASAPDSSSTRVAQALAYEHGEGVVKDPLRAAALYCEAARDGEAEAQYSLGWMYANGRGVPHDEAIAAAFFALAAAAGYEPAQKALGFIGEPGTDLPGCMRAPDPIPDSPGAGSDKQVDPLANLPPWKQKIADQVALLAPRFAVEARLALAIIAVESNFEPGARSGKDARGLMQLIPETAARFSVRNSYDIVDNVRGGLAYLRWLLAYYKGYIVLAAAAYNAGESAVDRYRGIPPYPETREYVRRVLRLYGKARHPYDPRIVTPAPFLPRTD